MNLNIEMNFDDIYIKKTEKQTKSNHHEISKRTIINNCWDSNSSIDYRIIS
ncbi:hypothetical protein D3C86_1863680 [compost metagenome]